MAAFAVAFAVVAADEGDGLDAPTRRAVGGGSCHPAHPHRAEVALVDGLREGSGSPNPSLRPDDSWWTPLWCPKCVHAMRRTATRSGFPEPMEKRSAAPSHAGLRRLAPSSVGGAPAILSRVTNRMVDPVPVGSVSLECPLGSLGSRAPLASRSRNHMSWTRVGVSMKPQHGHSKYLVARLATVWPRLWGQRSDANRHGLGLDGERLVQHLLVAGIARLPDAPSGEVEDDGRAPRHRVFASGRERVRRPCAGDK